MKIEEVCRILKECWSTVRDNKDYGAMNRQFTKCRGGGYCGSGPGPLARSYHLMAWLEHFLRTDVMIEEKVKNLERESTIMSGDPNQLVQIRRQLKSVLSVEGELVQHLGTLASMLGSDDTKTGGQFYLAINKTLDLLDEASEAGYYSHYIGGLERLKREQTWPLLDPESTWEESLWNSEVVGFRWWL